MALRDLDSLAGQMISQADFSGSMQTGEWRFLIALLDRAVKDLRDPNVAVRNSARAWIAYTGPGILGFEEVCDFLGMDSGWVRGVLRSAGLIESNVKLPLAA